jgi:hypothetical protein
VHSDGDALYTRYAQCSHGKEEGIKKKKEQNITNKEKKKINRRARRDTQGTGEHGMVYS